MQWYYLDANQQQIPADENELGGLVQSGHIQAGSMLWNETLPDWQPAATLFPTWFPEPVQQAPAAVAPSGPRLAAGRPASIGMVKRPIKTGGGGGGPLARSRGGGRSSAVAEVEEEAENPTEMIRDLAAFLGVNAGWMKFLGVMGIIAGILNCLTVVGALVGWLPIWLGVILMRAANAVTAAQISGNIADMEESLDRVGFYFKLQGILILVGLIFYALLIVLVILGGFLPLLLGGGLETIPTE